MSDLGGIRIGAGMVSESEKDPAQILVWPGTGRTLPDTALAVLGAVETVDLARLLLDLLIVIAAAKLAAEVAERLGIPAVLGEITAGILVGPSVLGLVELGGERGISLGMLAEIGVLLLLVQVGMEMDLAELGRVGRASMLVAVIGVVVPFAAGAGAGVGLGWDTDTAIFLGAALTATSVGLTARVFGDLHALATIEARVVLGAAVADDVLGLIILTVVVKVVTGDAVTVGLVTSTVLQALAFLVLSGLFAIFVLPRALRAVHQLSRSGSTLTVTALVVILGLAVLADAAQLAFIIGAFMAGLAIGRSDHHERIASDLNSVGSVFIPVFFVLIGVNADLGAMLRPSVLFDAAVLLAIAVAGKMVSAYGAAGTAADRPLVGFGMIPRGEVGLIFASIGLSRGVLDDELYGALLLVVLLTTVITPPLLRWRLGAGGRADVTTFEDAADSEPGGGWVSSRGGEIVLVARPASSSIAHVALQAAALAHGGRPSEELLEWFGERRSVPVDWTSRDTELLVDVLRRGNPRAVRLLDVTGVLERGVPTIAAAVARRRADPSELDPGRVLRFPTIALVEELLVDSGDSSRTGWSEQARATALAALVVDVLGVDATTDEVRRLLSELTVPDPAPIEHLVGSARLLRAAAGDLDAYAEAELRQLATHIGSPTMAESAYLLAVASSPDDRHRDRLDQLYGLLMDILVHPEVLGQQADSLAASRREQAERLVTEAGATRRLRAAPVSYLLTHEPDELARQARLVEPLPAAGTVRVAVSPAGTPDHWLIDVACRDSDGLLARLTRTLTASGCDIAAATVATWPDGAVVDSFLVRSAIRPRARHLAEQMEAGLDQRLVVEVATGLRPTFDNEALPWHTACTVTGRDRPGALSSLTAAFAAAGAVVHSARVATIDGDVVDRFTLSDRHGRKLDDHAIARVTAALDGELSRRSRFMSRR